jgi:hypothetical protein
MSRNRRRICSTLTAAATLLTAALMLVQTAQAGELRGGLTDAAGRGLPGIQVTLHDFVGTALYTTTSRADGVATFADVPAGYYRVRFVDPAGVYLTQSYPGLIGESLQLGSIVQVSAAWNRPFSDTLTAFDTIQPKAVDRSPSSPVASLPYGSPLALSGDDLVMGSGAGWSTSPVVPGSATVLARLGGSWSPQAQLVCFIPGAGYVQLGCSTAISGGTAIVGRQLGGDNMTSGMPGSACVFVRENGIWSHQAELLPAEGAKPDYGMVVAASGDTAVVSAPWASYDGGECVGKVFVFVRIGSVWTQQAELQPEVKKVASFGWSLILQGDTLIIGARHDWRAQNYGGSVYVFEREGGVWRRADILTPADPAYAGMFGSSLALSGETLLVGAPGYDDYVGCVYVFEREGGIWRERGRLFAPDGPPNSKFGKAVALSGDLAAVGAPDDGLGTPNDGYHTMPGSVHVFRRVGGEWEYVTKLVDRCVERYGEFGSSVAITGNTVLASSLSEGRLLVYTPYVTEAGVPLTVAASDGLLSNLPAPTPKTSAVLDSPPAYGSIALAADGSFTYSPAAGFCGEDTFTYHLVTGGEASAPAAVTVLVRDGSDLTAAAYGSPDGWVNHSVAVRLKSMSRRRGGDSGTVTQYRKVGAKTTPWSTYSRPIRVTRAGVSTYDYRASDLFGNTSGLRQFVVRIDRCRPRPRFLRSAVCARGDWVKLRFRIADAKPSCGRARTTILVRTQEGRVVKRLQAGVRITNKDQSLRFLCRLPSGTYRLYLRAKDAAGNRQAVAGVTLLRVR